MKINCYFQKAFDFTYHAKLEDGLEEHEYDHVFVGKYDGLCKPNPAEVMAHKWVAFATLRQELSASPENYTAWFGIALDRVITSFDRMKLELARRVN